MGRPTREQQAERLSTENTSVNKGPDMPNPGAEGVVGNSNTPETNTHEGILQKQADAESEAGLIPVDTSKPVDPLDINAANTDTGRSEGVVTSLNNSTSQESQAAGVHAGDTLAEAKHKIDDLRENGGKPDPDPKSNEDKKPAGKRVDPKDYVYHGDFLTDGQIGRPITFDWDEVTAPDHLAQRPEVNQSFVDRK